jgi:hypothetical protein
MRAPLLLVLSAATIFACTANDAENEPPPRTDVKPSEPAPLPAPPADAGADRTADAAPPPKKNECKLAAMTGVTDVAPAFVVGAPAPPSGGTLAGHYTVEKATVYLPSASAGLVDPAKSEGTINGWAVFEGASYRLHLKADFTVATVAGPQSQGADTESQGGFTTDGAVLLLDHACDGTIANEADYAFSDGGGGKATLLIRTSTPYGDIYLQLDASKS